MYEVYPEGQNTRLQMIASLDITSGPHDDVLFYSMSLNRLIFLHGKELKNWDYVAGAWASWEVDEGVEFERVRRFPLYEAYVSSE